MVTSGAGPMSSPLFRFMRGVAGVVTQTTAELSAVAAQPPPPPAPSAVGMDRSQFLAITASGVALAGILTAGFGCARKPFLVVHRDPEILLWNSEAGKVSPKLQEEVLAAYQQLPPSVQRVLRENHFRIYLSYRVQEHDEDVHSIHAIGEHQRAERRLIIAERTASGFHNSNPRKTFFHEAGHAYDWGIRADSTSDYNARSNHPSFYTALLQDMNKHSRRTKDEVRNLLYGEGYSGATAGAKDPYRPNWYRNSEVWAILFALMLQGQWSHPLLTNLPKTTAYVKYYIFRGLG